MATLLQRANFNGRNGSYFFLDLYYDLLSQNQTANTSSVRYYAYVGSTGGYSGSGSSSAVSINGTVVGHFSSIGRGSNTLIGTLDVTINHDTNGNGTASYSASANTNWTLGTASLSGSFTLPRIARADNITSPMVYTIGATHTIRITQNSTSFTHTVRYTFGSLNGTIASNVKDSCTWFVPTTFYNEFTSGSSKTGTLYCDTYSGSTLLGTTSITATFIPNSTTAKPTVSFNYTSDSLSQTLTGNTKGIIGGRSSINYTITGTPKHNATITKYYLSNSSTNLPEVSKTGTINNVSGNKYYTRVQDSRGLNSDTLTVTLSPYVSYVQLAITSCTFERENDLSNSIHLTLKGNYFNGNFGATDNELSVKLFYRKQGESSWGNAIDITSYAAISGNTFSITNQLIGSNFSYEDSYEFRVVAQDKVVTDDSVSSNRTVTEGIASFDIGKNDVKYKDTNILTFENSNTYINGELNILNTNKKISDLIVENVTGQHWRYDASTYTSGAVANGWRAASYPITTDSLPAGTYLITANFAYGTTQNNALAIATTRIVLDAVEIYYQRSSIPVGSGITASGQIDAIVDFNQKQTHTMYLDVYPTATITTVSAAFFVITRLK